MIGASLLPWTKRNVESAFSVGSGSSVTAAESGSSAATRQPAARRYSWSSNQGDGPGSSESAAQIFLPPRRKSWSAESTISEVPEHGDWTPLALSAAPPTSPNGSSVPSPRAGPGAAALQAPASCGTGAAAAGARSRPSAASPAEPLAAQGYPVFMSSRPEAEIQFCADWANEVEKEMRELNMMGNHTLVTDRLGVEVFPFGPKRSEPIAKERFPLRIARYGTRKGLFGGRDPPSKTASQTSRDSSQDTPLSTSQTQMSREISFADVWPGILDIRLSQYGVHDTNSLVVTDVFGVEMDLEKYRSRAPDAECFPLKLHFRTHVLGPQNLKKMALATQATLNGARSNSSMGSLFTESLFCDHSLELSLNTVLQDVLEHNLAQMGFRSEQSVRDRVILTDCIGVIVSELEGIPAGSRFPFKMHVETLSLPWESENTVGWHLWKDSAARRGRRKSACQRGPEGVLPASSIGGKLVVMGETFKQRFFSSSSAGLAEVEVA